MPESFPSQVADDAATVAVEAESERWKRDLHREQSARSAAGVALRAAHEADPVVRVAALREWINERRDAGAPSGWVAKGIADAANAGYEAMLDDLDVLLDDLVGSGA